MSTPHRIVSLVPSTTESVCAFGAGERFVGGIDWCFCAEVDLPRFAG